MRKPTASRTTTFAFFLAFGVSACSPEMFDQKKTDSSIDNRTQYRKPQPSCAGLDLSSAEFTPKSFRQLVACFNGNGSIADLDALVQESSDAQIESIVSLMNRSVLGNKTRLFQSRETLRSLKSRGQIDELVAGLGKLLADEKRIKAILELIDSSRGTALEPNAAEKKALVSWIKKLKPEGFFRFIEILRKTTGSSAYRELREKIRTQTMSEAESKRLAKLWKTLVAKPVAGGKTERLVQALASGKAEAMLNQALGSDADSIRSSVPDATLVLKTLFADEGATWKTFSKLHGSFEKPISCMDGGKVFQEPWKDLHRELESHVGQDFFDFTTRFAVTTTVGLAGGFCDVPKAFYDSYPTFLKFAATNAGKTFSRTVEAATRGGICLSLGTWMSDTGDEFGEIVAAVEKRGLTADLILMLAALDQKDRDFLAEGVQSLFVKDPAIGNAIPWSRLTSWASRLSEQDWLDLSDLVGEALGTDTEDSVAAFTAMREFMLANSSHPWFEAVRDILIESLEGGNDVFGLSEVARLPSFPRAVKLLHEMSQDERLTSLLLGFFDLIAQYAEEGRVAMDLSPVVKPSTPARHAFSSRDLPTIALKQDASKSLQACLKVNLRSSLASQSEAYFDCLGSQPSLRGAEEALTILAREKTSSGETFASMLGARALDLPFMSAKESEAFLKGLNSAMREGRIENSARALESALFGVGGSNAGVYDPAMALTRGVRQGMGSDFRVFLKGLGAAIGDADAGKALKLATQAGRAQAVGLAARPANVYDRPRLERWIRNKECLTDPSLVRARRAIIEEDFESALSGWELVGGQYRQQWNRAELWKRLAPALKRMARPGMSAGIAKTIHGFADHPEAVIQWFRDRAVDYRIIHVIPQGEKYPRVRLMNSLDRLEVLLKAADFKYFFPENFALKFMGMIGEAWGDEPREKWPAEIRARYANGGRPLKLAEAFEEMKKTLERYEKMGGLPHTGRCAQVADPNDPIDVQRYETTEPDRTISIPIPQWVKTNLFNLHQTISVLEENLPGSGHEMDSGIKFLRDLFWGVHSSVPVADRTDRDETRNGLGLILELNDVSFLRAFSVYFMDLRDSALVRAHNDAVRFFAQFFESPASQTVLKDLLSGEGLEFTKALYDASAGVSGRGRAVFYLAGQGGRLGLGTEMGKIAARELPGLFPGLKLHAKPLLDAALSAEMDRFSRALYVNSESDAQAALKRWLDRRVKDDAFVRAGSRAIKTILLDDALMDRAKTIARELEKFGESSDFRRFEVEETMNALLDYFAQTDVSASSLSAARFRGWIAARFAPTAGGQGPSDIEELVRFATEKPDQFSKVLRGGLEGARSQTFVDFMEILERHLPR